MPPTKAEITRVVVEIQAAWNGKSRSEVESEELGGLIEKATEHFPSFDSLLTLLALREIEEDDVVRMVCSYVPPTLTSTWTKKLHAVEKKLQDKMNRSLSEVGLILNKEIKSGGYGHSPLNGVCFARTGGDGDHFSLLCRAGEATDQSPVILTWPADACNHVAAPDMETFLRTGLHCGFDQYLAVFDHPKSDDEGYWYDEDALEADQIFILKTLAAELSLEPMPAIKSEQIQWHANFRNEIECICAEE